MTTATLAYERADTTDLVAVHRVFRREFGLAPDLVRAVPEGDVARADFLAAHLGTVVAGLRHHNSCEDELLWPLLVERARPSAELERRMHGQHARVAAFVTGVETLLPLWRASAREDTRDRLAELLRELGRALDALLAEEELEVFPLAERHLTAAEIAAVADRGRAGLTRSQLMTYLGALLEDAEPTHRTAFLERLPAPARLLWRAGGRRRYRRTITRIRTV